MTTILTTIVSVIMSFYHQQKLRMCIKRLAAVNDTLEQLGTPKAYRKMHMYSKQVRFEICLKRFAIVDDTLEELGTPKMYIGNRFDKINEHMQCLVVKEEYKFKRTWKKPVAGLHRYTLCTHDYKTTFWVLMHLHLELCRIAREWNSMFGMQITLEMTSYFASISTMCYGLFVMQVQEHREQIPTYTWINVIYWTSTLIVRLYIINHIYESIKVKFKKIDKIIHQLTNILQYADIWKEIYQFSLQTMYHPLEFTAMNLFHFGNDFLRKFCMTVLTYVIIMVQMSVAME
ncbi:uncharacterized protein LOC115236973 [Formica exsecta]|uniref:uncharacterized protein LOC115236973 n=1 Tax=Formica exsecta TaxID=72781 RepID=UPI001142E334|nr:uncharacterized protein LOC115236973 [Formica exsecta]